MRFILITLLSFLIITAYAAYPNELPKNTPASVSWVFSRANACLNADNITRVSANGECLALQTYFGKIMPIAHPILLIFIHGDGIPGGGPSDYLKYQATKFSASNIVPIVLIRPGYYDSYDHYSTGESYAFSHNGYPNDSYRSHTVATLADAVQTLKHFYGASCTILVGHSGGAMMSAIMLGKYPGIANAAVLASVVGNVHEWASMHHYGAYPYSLSPNDFINHIPKTDAIYIISGTNDANTYPVLSKNYYNLLKAKGIHVYWYAEQGGTHNSVVLSQTEQFDHAIHDALLQCQ